jgi:hypothetical protein
MLTHGRSPANATAPPAGRFALTLCGRPAVLPAPRVRNVITEALGPAAAGARA